MSSPEGRARSSSLTAPTQPSVRVRRSRAPTLAGGAPLAPIPSEAVASDFAVTAAADSSTNGAPVTRRRRGTLTERLFQQDGGYGTIDEDEHGHARPRSSSRASRTSANSAGAPVDVVLPTADGSAAGRRRGLSVSSSMRSRVADDHHYDEEVQVLEVLDQAVSTTSNLANIQAAFWPNTFTRRPVVELEAPSEEALAVDDTTAAAPAAASSSDDLLAEEEELDSLDSHLRKLVLAERKKARRKVVFKQTMRGVWAFMCTPLGVCATIYMLLVVVAGGALVLLLMIPMGSYAKKLWVEICSQILTGLFTLTSLLPLPWRLWDTYNIWTICHYAVVTRRRRKKQSLPPLRDPNDLPERPDTEFWVGPGGVPMTGPRPVSSYIPVKQKSKHAKKGRNVVPEEQEADAGLELSQIEKAIGSSTEELEDEAVVLTEKEQARLHRCQLRYSKSQTYYRAHTSPTHHAFPLHIAFWISILMIGNSVFQAMLCGVMWGLDRFERPAWVTGCLIPLSFGCMIGASVMMWLYGERTKRKAEVSRKVWAMLKRDEKDLETKRLAIIEQRKADKKLHHHHQQQDHGHHHHHHHHGPHLLHVGKHKHEQQNAYDRSQGETNAAAAPAADGVEVEHKA